MKWYQRVLQLFLSRAPLGESPHPGSGQLFPDEEPVLEVRHFGKVVTTVYEASTPARLIIELPAPDEYRIHVDTL